MDASHQVVGLPFKDISTTDALLLSAPPPLDDTLGRQTLKRLMDVAILPVIPAAALAAAPVEGAVALVSLEEAASGAAPPCAGRVVVRLSGEESERRGRRQRAAKHAPVTRPRRRLRRAPRRCAS